MSDETLGAHIYSSLDSNIYVLKSSFLSGISRLGGAIYLEGNSTVGVFASNFNQNFARRRGGAIYADGFQSITVGQGTQFVSNMAVTEGLGDDIFVTNTDQLLNVSDTKFLNPGAVQSIRAELANVSLFKVTMKTGNSIKSRAKQNGGALNCLNCRGLYVSQSSFSGQQANLGGAFHLEESEDNKRLSDRRGKYRILGSTFNNCSAFAGGALYLDNPQFLTVGQGTTFSTNTAFNTSEKEYNRRAGSGGAIYYTCNSKSISCLVSVEGGTKYLGNYAAV